MGTLLGLVHLLALFTRGLSISCFRVAAVIDVLSWLPSLLSCLLVAQIDV